MNGMFFFSVYAVQLLINNGTSLWKPAHCVRGEKKDPLDLHRTLNIVLLLVFMSGALYEFLGRSWWACPGRSVVNGITNRGGAFMRLPVRVGQWNGRCPKTRNQRVVTCGKCAWMNKQLRLRKRAPICGLWCHGIFHEQVKHFGGGLKSTKDGTRVDRHQHVTTASKQSERI